MVIIPFGTVAAPPAVGLWSTRSLATSGFAQGYIDFHDSAPLALAGVVNGTLFSNYLQQCVVPTLQPGEVLVMDNLSAHKVAGIEELIRACGAQVLYLPPYSSDFNPIELAWSKVKTTLRRLKARTFPDLIEALNQALRDITPQDIRGWFAHCGYPIN